MRTNDSYCSLFGKAENKKGLLMDALNTMYYCLYDHILVFENLYVCMSAYAYREMQQLQPQAGHWLFVPPIKEMKG